MQANTHPQQEERLRALRSYEILDTDREADFDDIAKLASEICGTAISVVNLIDSDRQWFKAETGLGVRETPLETSICSHVILESEFTEIPDTLSDPRMADNPLCTGDPGLRFYAGALLKSDDGLPIGTLCVLDWQPRTLTPLQRNALRVLARQVMAQLEMRRALRANKVMRQEVDHRVKNSLQSLAGLVRMQSRGAKSDETRTALDTVQSRIKAVADLHQLLYRTDKGAVIDIKDYIGLLSGNLSDIAPEGVTFDAQSVSCAILANEAVAIGTLVNEFAANSYKHAFPDGRAGHVTVRVEQGATANHLRVTCCDNGVGLPADARADSGGLGQMIAQVISAELQTVLEVSSSTDGLTIALEFETTHR